MTAHQKYAREVGEYVADLDRLRRNIQDASISLQNLEVSIAQNGGKASESQKAIKNELLTAFQKLAAKLAALPKPKYFQQ